MVGEFESMKHCTVFPTLQYLISAMEITHTHKYTDKHTHTLFEHDAIVFGAKNLSKGPDGR
jgi:hypothetical protein